MGFPFGELLIFFLALVTWTEKRASRKFFYLLLLAWLIGKCGELVFPVIIPWHWHFARLAAMLFFAGWAWQRAERRMLPLLFTSFFFCLETLFLVNEPGIIPHESWLFVLIPFLVAWLTARSYWGTAAAFTGGVLLNQIFKWFTYEGIIRSADFPEPIVWHLTVILFAFWGGLRLVRLKHAGRVTAQAYEPSEEQELV